MRDSSGHPANRLSKETSPYLLQHAHNPVDWFAWGEEAFAEARRRDVPIFLSIGYSTCYWCHVMERECFEDEGIARRMSEGFVCIKVDREERPDVDDLYMTATQLLTGRGGWPMSVFLEPIGLRPFWCGTYFPPEPRHGMPSFPQVLEAMGRTWRERRAEATEQSESVAEGVRQHMASADAPASLGLDQVSGAARELLQQFDRVRGGFGGAPKFPQPAFLEFLLDVRAAAADEATRGSLDQVVKLTLDRMATGGLFDQIGGGFHRYSVDDRWLVPHFEKMLYDNAQLAQVYARAAGVYSDSFYAATAQRTLDYILREMTTADGAFCSAQDAEVGGHEGGNYVWMPEEVKAALPAADADFAVEVYGLNGGPNFRDPHHPDEPAANVLHLRDRPDALAASMRIGAAELEARLSKINAALLEARSRRPQPRLDDKVIVAWNGLMIGAMARAGSWLPEPKYVAAAGKATDFILGGLRDSSAGLLRTFRAGIAKTPAFLEDYAFLIDGLLALTDAGQDRLAEARSLVAEAQELFGDEHGGFYDTRDRQSDLFIRARSTHDGAIPSGSSVMLNNLIALYDRTHESAFLESAIGTLRSLSAAIARSPASTINATRGLLGLIGEGDAVATRLGSLGPAAPAPLSDAVTSATTPVEVYASEDRVQVGPDSPATLRLVVRIADGYHITAADPGPGGESLIPLRVSIVNGSGVAAYADYPAGDAYGPAEDIRVHRGSVEFDVALERTGEWSGRPLLAVTYQACTDTECLAPRTVELSVAIDRLA